MFETTNLLTFLEKISDTGWTVLPISIPHAQDLLKSAQARYARHEFHAAAIAKNANQPEVRPSIRNDSTCWLTENSVQLTSAENMALQNLNWVKNELSRFFRIGLIDFECHYAVYSPGGSYAKHLDQKKVNNKRFFSIVIYLNENWSDQDGGQLIGYDTNEQKIFEISPRLGHAVLFRSDIEHEVLAARHPRWSLTGWFRTI